MSGSINKVILVGNLGRDPDVRAMQNGDKVVQLSIATSDRWKDKNTGEQKERRTNKKLTKRDRHTHRSRFHTENQTLT